MQPPTPTPLPTPPGGFGESDVTFFDYDGTIVASYTATEFANLSALPENPSHAGLIAQGWNWTRAEIQEQMTRYPNEPIYVGQMYTTESGATEIDIELLEGRLTPVFRLYSTGIIRINFGDNTPEVTIAPSSTSDLIVQAHQYASPGIYTVSINTLSSSSDTKYWFPNDDSFISNEATPILGTNYGDVYKNGVLRIRISNSLSLIRGMGNLHRLESVSMPDGTWYQFASGTFARDNNLRYITIPKTISILGTDVFSSCTKLEHISIPYGLSQIGTNCFRNTPMKYITMSNNISYIGTCAFQSSEIERLTIPNLITTLYNGLFQFCSTLSSVSLSSSLTSIEGSIFHQCENLRILTIPSTVISIGAAAFKECAGLKSMHILPTTPPTITATTFQSLAPDFVIYVPQGCLETYQTATNWSELASQMQEEPA